MSCVVPYVPSPIKVVRYMLKLAKVKAGEIVYDLGCGDGRILIIAAKEFNAYGVGIEKRRDLVEEAIRNVKKAGVEDRVIIIEGDFFEIDISEADVVTLYLLTSVNEKLRPKLERELKPTARVVSHDFEVPGWTPVKVAEISEGWRTHKIYLYHMSSIKDNRLNARRSIDKYWLADHYV